MAQYHEDYSSNTMMLCRRNICPCLLLPVCSACRTSSLGAMQHIPFVIFLKNVSYSTNKSVYRSPFLPPRDIPVKQGWRLLGRSNFGRDGHHNVPPHQWVGRPSPLPSLLSLIRCSCQHLLLPSGFCEPQQLWSGFLILTFVLAHKNFSFTDFSRRQLSKRIWRAFLGKIQRWKKISNLT